MSEGPHTWKLQDKVEASSHRGLLASQSLSSSSLLIIIHNDICKTELLQSTVSVNGFCRLSQKSLHASDEEPDLLESRLVL